MYANRVIVLIFLVTAIAVPFFVNAHWLVETAIFFVLLGIGIAIAGMVERRRIEREYRTHACDLCPHRLDWRSAHDAQGNCKPVPSVTYPPAKIRI